MKLKKLPNLKLKIQKEFDFNLPVDYVVSKFYEFGYKVTHNKTLNNYQSCCPLCREGKSWGKKKRCIYTPEEGLIGCYNCGERLSTYNWVRRVSGMTHKELVDTVEADNYDVLTVLDETPKKEIVVATLPEDSINLFDHNQVEFFKDDKRVKFVLNYIKTRRLDTAINRPDALYISLKDKFQGERLVIPFKDEEGDIVFFQTRKLFDWDDKPNYLSKLKADKTLYGINKVDPEMDSVFLFEGPIDAFFVKNGIGVAGINKGHHTLTATQKSQMESLRLFNKIWVLDSQWKDDTAREKTISLLEMGETVFIWPKKWGEAYKDFNEMCVDCEIDQISPEFIKKHAVSGMLAVLKFKMMIR